MSLLKNILSPDSCGKCRVCCGFVEDDKWEIPLIFADNREETERLTRAALVPRGSEYVFDMKFNGAEIIPCPALSENGCTLGELKPFDCAVWPFRVNSLGDFRVITVSPVCETVSALPLSELCDFLRKDGFAERLFDMARLHPDIVKPYLDGYPILAVENN